MRNLAATDFMNDHLGSTRCCEDDLGKPIPDSEHAVSVCLPLWEHNIGYEEAHPPVVERLKCGYPRFYLHPAIVEFFSQCETRFAGDDECCFAFPSRLVAERCVEFLRDQADAPSRLHDTGQLGIVAVSLPRSARKTAMAFWQHSGEILSSRLVAAARNQQQSSPAVENEKQQIRQRIADHAGSNRDDVYLFPTGMAAIFCAYRILQKLRPGTKSVQFGFPYVDILKIQERFAARADSTRGEVDTASTGVHFFPSGDETELERLARVLESEQVMALFCEFPGNPLLKSPDLRRLSSLADEHQFPLFVDDTLGAFLNTDVLPVADVTATSLTKFFSGRGDVMGGALVLNEHRPFYSRLKDLLQDEFEDLLFAEDAIVLEQNSRDVVDRVNRINTTAEELCEFLQRHPAIARVDYPKYRTRDEYRAFLKPNGGYGGLFSLQLHEPEKNATAFYDNLKIAKGPNLGTNFSLCCPYTILAHYEELDFAERCGISRYLLRCSVGLEELDWLKARFGEALDSLPTAASDNR